MYNSLKRVPVFISITVGDDSRPTMRLEATLTDGQVSRLLKTIAESVEKINQESSQYSPA